MQIRPATPADRDAIWSILEPVIRAGETYTLDRDMSREEALAYWLGADRTTFVAEAEAEAEAEAKAGAGAESGAGAGAGARILGTYYLRANQAGGGAHVCNCGYMTAAEAAGQGVARAMAAHSFVAARAAGFRAMQFNFVVSSNERAVRLWTSMGFATVGRLPGAFDHPQLGEVDALVMFRRL